MSLQPCWAYCFSPVLLLSEHPWLNNNEAQIAASIKCMGKKKYNRSFCTTASVKWMSDTSRSTYAPDGRMRFKDELLKSLEFERLLCFKTFWAKLPVILKTSAEPSWGVLCLLMLLQAAGSWSFFFKSSLVRDFKYKHTHPHSICYLYARKEGWCWTFS